MEKVKGPEMIQLFQETMWNISTTSRGAGSAKCVSACRPPALEFLRISAQGRIPPVNFTHLHVTAGSGTHLPRSLEDARPVRFA